MDFYRIGPEGGPFRVGIHKAAGELHEEMAKASPPGLTVKAIAMDTGRAMLALRVFQVGHRQFEVSTDGEWFALKPDVLDTAMQVAAEQVNAITQRPADGWQPNLAAVMLYARRTIFRTTQDTMGLICGRPPVYVSRWESGVGTPGLEELLRIRAAALSLGLPWDDSEIFEISQSEWKDTI